MNSNGIMVKEDTTRKRTVDGTPSHIPTLLKLCSIYSMTPPTKVLFCMECGPTIVGDEWSDTELMEYLDATLTKALGNNFLEYRTNDAPRIVLNKLEKRGYKVVSMCGIGQTCIWTLHKPEHDNNTALNNASNKSDIISNSVIS